MPLTKIVCTLARRPNPEVIRAMIRAGMTVAALISSGVTEQAPDGASCVESLPRKGH